MQKNHFFFSEKNQKYPKCPALLMGKSRPPDVTLQVRIYKACFVERLCDARNNRRCKLIIVGLII